jgi:hypothetical protein
MSKPVMLALVLAITASMSTAAVVRRTNQASQWKGESDSSTLIVSDTQIVSDGDLNLTRHYLRSHLTAHGEAQPYVVVYVFAGRQDRMHLLMKYLDKMLVSGDVNEVHLWDRTRSQSDALWLQGDALAPIHSENRAQVTNFQKTSDVNMNSREKWGSIYAHYGRSGKFKPRTPVALQDIVFVKADDDTVYIDTSKFKSFATYISTHPGMFIVHANIVNNGVAAYHQSQHIKALAEEVPATTIHPPDGDGGSLFEDNGERALALHQFFLKHRDAFSWEDSTIENCIQFNPGRFSINFFGARGENMDRIAELGNSVMGDEFGLTWQATRNVGLKECMFTPFNVAHLSFSPQKAANSILPAYESLWESLNGHASS